MLVFITYSHDHNLNRQMRERVASYVLRRQLINCISTFHHHKVSSSFNFMHMTILIQENFSGNISLHKLSPTLNLSPAIHLTLFTCLGVAVQKAGLLETLCKKKTNKTLQSIRAIPCEV